jgi:hypothetical protein
MLTSYFPLLKRKYYFSFFFLLSLCPKTDWWALKPSGSHMVGLYWILQVVAECLPVAIGSVVFMLIGNVHTILQGQGRCILPRPSS